MLLFSSVGSRGKERILYTILDVGALWRSFWSGHLNQCQCSDLRVVKSLTNDGSSANFLIRMVVNQWQPLDNQVDLDEEV